MTAEVSAGRRGFPALLEALRAPLLASPAADVLAGWALATFNGGARSPGPWLAASAIAACFLLAAGMASNALVDHEEDRRDKPSRPLPRGAVTERQLQWTWCLLSLGALALLARDMPALSLGVAILIGTALYHHVLKTRRFPGCAVLGLLRGASMGLGVLVAAEAQGEGADLSLGLLACALYAVYIFGASLHASTDDQPAPRETDDEEAAPTQGFSAVGLGCCFVVLGLWTLFTAIRMVNGEWLAGAALGTLIWAITRLADAARKLPPPAITGAALSGLHLLHAGTVFLVGDMQLAGVILALFMASRLALRSYPPS